MSVNVRIRNGLEPNLGSGGASEGDLRGNHSDIIEQSAGVVDVAGGHLLVHEATSPAMTVVVDAGVGYIPNTSFSDSDSDSIKFWEAVVAGTTGSRTLVIGANSSGQTRIDVVCISLDTGEVPDEFASDVAVLLIVAGTPGAGAPATPSNHVKLAEVTVVNGAATIEDDDITDSRVQLTIKNSFISTPASWANYTPTWTSSGSNPSLVNGSLFGRYIQDGKTITAAIRLVAGSTTTFGSGAFFFALPVAPETTIGGRVVGNAYLLDASTGIYYVLTATIFGTDQKIRLLSNASSSAVSGTSPVATAQNDDINILVVYEAA